MAIQGLLPLGDQEPWEQSRAQGRLALNLGPPTHPSLPSLLTLAPWHLALGWLRNGPCPGQALPSGSRQKDKGSGGEQPGRAAGDWDLPAPEYLLAPGNPSLLTVGGGASPLPAKAV